MYSLLSTLLLLGGQSAHAVKLMQTTPTGQGFGMHAQMNRQSYAQQTLREVNHDCTGGYNEVFGLWFNFQSWTVVSSENGSLTPGTEVHVMYSSTDGKFEIFEATTPENMSTPPKQRPGVVYDVLFPFTKKLGLVDDVCDWHFLGLEEQTAFDNDPLIKDIRKQMKSFYEGIRRYIDLGQCITYETEDGTYAFDLADNGAIANGEIRIIQEDGTMNVYSHVDLTAVETKYVYSTPNACGVATDGSDISQFPDYHLLTVESEAVLNGMDPYGEPVYPSYVDFVNAFQAGSNIFITYNNQGKKASKLMAINEMEIAQASIRGNGNLRTAKYSFDPTVGTLRKERAELDGILFNGTKISAEGETPVYEFVHETSTCTLIPVGLAQKMTYSHAQSRATQDQGSCEAGEIEEITTRTVTYTCADATCYSGLITNFLKEGANVEVTSIEIREDGNLRNLSIEDMLPSEMPVEEDPEVIAEEEGTIIEELASQNLADNLAETA